MKNLHSKMLNKGLAVLIALVLAVGGMPITALAENEHAPDDYEYATSGVTVSGAEDEGSPQEGDPSKEEAKDGHPADAETPEAAGIYGIVAFAPLADGVANQSVEVGALIEALTLPDTLAATVSDGDTETNTVIEDVTWQSEPKFEAVSIGEMEIVPAGTYAFTPVLPEGYGLSDGVTLPVITVEVVPVGIVPAAAGTPEAEQDMYGPWSVFANGTAITVKADGGQTKIYRDSDTSTPLNLFDGSDYTSSYCIIYGGWKEGSNSGDTSVTIEGDTTVFTVYGGSLGGSINGNTSVTIKDMTASAADLTVYGGGRFASVTGDTSVTIENSTISGAPSNGIYGGGNAGSVNGNTSVYIDNSTIADSIHVYGGCYEASVTGNASVAIDNATVTNNVYGGGYTSDASVGSTNVEIKNNSNVYMALGGGDSGSVGGNTSVSIEDSTITGNVYGGGNGGDVAGNTSINMTNSIVANNGLVLGGGHSANVNANVSIVIENSEVTGWVYGGGGNGSVTGDTSVTLTNATVGRTVFGGGCWNDNFAVGGDSSVEIDGGTYAWVYGGGDSGPVAGKASVSIKNATVSGGVFGGGGGWNGDATVGSSTVTIAGNTVSNVYGGGDEGDVAGAAIVNIYPGATISGTVTFEGYDTVVVGEGSKVNYWHKVKYALNGGTGTAPTESGTNGYVAAGTAAFTAASASGITPPGGKQFKEWNTNSGGTGTSYAPNAAVDIPVPLAHPYSDFTLHAVWENAPITAAALTVTPPATGAAKTDASVGGSANYTHTSTAWTVTNTSTAAGTYFTASTAYTATITLTAKTNYVFGTVPTGSVTGTGGTVISAATSPDKSTLTIVVNYPALPAKAVDSITVTTQPKLTYVTGDKLDLSDLRVEVTYGDASTESIRYNAAGLTYKIVSDSVANGTTSMSHSKHDGEIIVVSYGNKTADTNDLTVYATPALQIAVSDIDSTSAKLIYSATTDSRNTVTSKLQVKRSGVWTDVAGAASPYTASGLSPNTSYEYRIWAQNHTTSRVYDRPITFRTAESASTGITLDGDIIDNTSPIAIWVTLEHGNTVISSVQATAKGGAANTYVFSFNNVPNGIFNLVVDNGSWKVTQAVTIVNGVVTHPIGRITIDMSTGRTQSIVDIVTDDTPPVAVGGLPELFDDNTIYTPADEAVVSGGGTVEIKLAVAAVGNPSDARNIDGAASGQTVGLYLDLSMLKSQFDDTGALLDESKLTDLNGNLITITFELPDDLKGKSNLTIYRVHNGTAEKLPPNPNPFNESADISDGIVTLNVCKFSTYAIAYTPSNPVNPPSSSGGGSSSGGSSGDGGTGVAVTESTYWIEASNAKALAKSAREQNVESVLTQGSGITGIRKKALQVLAKSDLSYRHDTIAGNSVQVRVYVDDPNAATKDILVSGYTAGNTVDKTISIINKWFSNDVAVISLDQQGDFGMNVRIAALVDLSGMNTGTLYFYSYDKATNKYKLIVTEYRLDSKGYVHFSTVLGGSIIITDRPLTKNGADAEEGADIYEPPITGGGLDNPATGGDGTGMYIPPAKAQAQDFVTAQAIIEAIAADGVLKLNNNSVPAAGNATGNLGSVLKINLDAPSIPELAQESGGFKLGAGMLAGIVTAMLLVSIILWAVIPRKDDELVQQGGGRKSDDDGEIIV